MSEKETVCYEITIRATDSNRTQELIFQVNAFCPEESSYEAILEEAKKVINRKLKKMLDEER